MRPRSLKETGREAAIDRRKTFYLQHGKRILDVLGALAGLIITSPILGFCAIAIYLDSPGPVFFRQWRIGEQSKPFQIFKLRTMVRDADQKGPKLTAAGDCRITRVGKCLRKTKLDEIPQLFNVLRGEMSFVGPRPEVPEYVATYTPEQKKLLEVKPGITGPASLEFIEEEKLLTTDPDRENFYVSTVLARKLELDLVYYQTASVAMDIKLILSTLRILLRTPKGKREGSKA
jgi:lipopolysaccharide/colanic/teichoic acid biosynthesis glycosyltransferase